MTDDAKRISLVDRMTRSLFAGEISRPSERVRKPHQVRRALLSAETDKSFTVGVQNLSQTRRDRLIQDRYEVLEDSLEAWRGNPLARRIVELTGQYVVGGGIQIDIKPQGTADFVEKFWNHRLNHMPIRVLEMCDELTRTGNLFVLISTDPGGMSYVRIIPAMSIDRIISKENDYETPVLFISKPFIDPYTGHSSEPYLWPAYDENLDGISRQYATKVPYQSQPLPNNVRSGPSSFTVGPDRPSVQEPVNTMLPSSPTEIRPDMFTPSTSPTGDNNETEDEFPPVMIQYAINRPSGAQWGEGDLAPLLRWLTRYANWLEDRARLNRFRNAFMYVVHAKFTSETERLARQTKLAASPPTPGSILVVDESETWEMLSPHLEASDANNDGLALKKMIAGGAGIPMHFLAEPESSTRTTAEAAGGPTYRRFEQRQLFFLWAIGDILRCVVNRRAMVDHRVSKTANIILKGADISGRDDQALSASAQNIAAVAEQLRDRGLIDDEEVLKLIYRFASEVVDPQEMLKRGAEQMAKTPKPAAAAPGAPGANESTTSDTSPSIPLPAGEGGKNLVANAPPETGSTDVVTGEMTD